MPKIIDKLVEVEEGTGSGLSVQWEGGQFVVIVTDSGVVACGAIDVDVMEEFDHVIAVAEGEPDNPLVMPEDLLDAEITEVTNKAKELGIETGTTGREALNKLLRA